MELKDYGWDAETAAQFETCAGPGLIPGRVVRQSRGRATLVTPMGELAGEVSGRFRHGATDSTDYPVVGDWAVVEPFGEGPALIHSLLPRRSSCSTRPNSART